MPEEAEFQEDLNGNDTVGSEDVVVGEKVLDKRVEKERGLEESVLEELVLEEVVLQEQVLQEQVLEEQVLQEQVLQEQVLEEQVLQEQVLEEQVLQEQVLEEKVLQEQVLQEQELEDQVLQEQVLEESVSEYPVLEESVLGEVVLEVPLVGEEVEVGEVVGNPIYHCHTCRKCYRTSRSLRDHMRYKHGPPASCDQCGKVFETQMKLQVHVRYMHSGIMFACTICQKKFKGRQNLARHVPSCTRGVRRRRAREDSQFNCEVCHKSFASKEALCLHFKRFHKIAVRNESTAFERSIFSKYHMRRRRRVAARRCSKCSQIFKGSSGLKRHMKVHRVVTVPGGEQAQPRPNFACESCGKEFGAKNVLARHTSECHPHLVLEFGCDKCDKKFTSRRAQKQHKSRSHKDTVFACHKCDSKFSQKQNMRAHLKKCKEGEIRKPKPYSELSPNGKKKRNKEILKKFSLETLEMSKVEKQKLFRAMVAECPEVLETYSSNPLSADDVLDIIRDVNLSNAQVIKIIVKLNRKWKGCISPKIRQALQKFQRTLDHLFTTKDVRGDEELHFEDVQGNPLDSRWVTYCTDLDTLLGAVELEEGEEAGDNVFGVDDGKKILKLIWNRVKRGEVGVKGKVGGGVKYSQVLFSVAGVKETYNNMKVSSGHGLIRSHLAPQVMFELLNLSSQHGRLALDLKLANIFSGLQPGSAKFPCLYAR